jgi:lipopolysaccharide export system permease protein
VRFREPRERSVGELFSVENDPTVGINDYGKFRMEGHKRLISPLNNMGFTLIALGFLLAGSPSRRGVSSRIVIAAGAVVAFSVLTLAFENLSAKNGAFIPFMYLAALLPSALGATALVQPPRRRVWAS